MKTLLLAAVIAVLSSSACGVAGESGGGYQPPAAAPTATEPDEPVVLTPEPGSDVHDVGDRPQRVRPRPGMADLRPVAWEKARQSAGGRSLLVTYWSGVEPCSVLDHVDVDYSPSKITVTLFEGHDPEAGDVACIEIALLKTVEVPLQEPVDGRKIVDGAK